MEQHEPGLTEALLTAAIQASANGIVITDRTGLIQWVNPAFTAMTGYPPATVIGQYPRVLKSGRHDAEFYRSLWATILEGHPWHGQMVNRRHDGSEYVEEMAITPVRDQAGEITHFIAIKQDISRRVQAEQQLRRAQKMEAVGLLAGGVAHDFNNLLTVINGYSDLILNPEEPAESHCDYARLIREAGDRGAALVRQLLAFSRGQVVEAVVLQVNTLISEMERMLQRLLPENIQFTSRLEPALAPVLADPGQIQQVLMNLVVNARDAMPEGGRLEVENGQPPRGRGLSGTAPDCSGGLVYPTVGLRTPGSVWTNLLRSTFRAVLHHQAAGRRHGLGTIHGLRHREAERRVGAG